MENDTLISAVICAYNEEERLPVLLESLKGIDEIVISDDGSTDKTVELAEGFGARVVGRSNFKTTPTGQDLADFCDKFNFKPSFDTETPLPHAGKVRNEALSCAKYDWVLNVDCDEIVSWDLPEIKKLLSSCDKIDHNFIHSRDEKGNPTSEHTISKLFKRSKYQFVGRVHEVIIGSGVSVYTDKMRVDHYRQPKDRSYVMPILEYAVLKDNDLRSRFYLGREYFYYQEWDKAINLFEEYLKEANWLPEIAEARKFLAHIYWQTGEGDKSRELALKVLTSNPQDKEVLLMMAEYYYEPWKSKWAYIAKNATNDDVLFGRL